MTRIKYFLVPLILGQAISISLQCNYESCPNVWDPSNPSIHTMCKYLPDSYGKECEKVITSGLTSEEIKEVLDRHNELRAKVAMGKESRGLNGGQPGGIIGPLAWDNKLAIVAQRWANQCVFDHDKCRDIDGIAIGQNLGYRGTSGILQDKFSDLITDWYDEVEDFNHQYVSNYQSVPGGAVTTHYTQLIWAKTTHVGCGGIKYKTSEFNKIHLVCNYRPKGNTIGEAVYEIDGRSISESDKKAPPFTHVSQFPKEHTDEFSDGSDKMAPPSAYFNGSNEPEKVFPNEPSEEPPSETIPDHPNLLAELPHKKHIKKTPYVFDNQFYNENTHQRPDLSVNRPSNQIQTRYSDECEYDQCEDKRERGTYKQHTMCQYPTSTVAATCGNVRQLGLNKTEETQILDLHNKFKEQALQEIAKRGIRRDQRIDYTGPLKWNHKLAEVAQRWANQCIYNKDECRNIYEIEVGQNVGQVSVEHEFRGGFSDIVEVMFYVRNHDDYNRPKPQSDYESKYYEQLVWANPTDIGCGGIKYVDQRNSFVTYLVCNYMPAEYITSEPAQDTIRPSYFPPGENVPVYKPFKQTDYKPFSAIQIRPIVTVRSGSDDCQYQNCANPKMSGKYYIHTMCQYLSVDPAKECYDVKRSSLNEEEKNKIIEILNQLIHPANRNVRSLQWNDELEQIAQRWANQCRMEIDPCKNMLDGSPVRQHFGWIKREHVFPSNFYNIIKSWNRDVPFEDNLTEVGCGIVEYIESENMYNTYLVCNYKTPRINNTRITNSVKQVYKYGIEF